MPSRGMLKTTTMKWEKPKKGDGWGKFVEWNRRWNKILSVLFGILSFSLLFAIVLANILHTDYKNYDFATTTTAVPTTTSRKTSTIPTPSTPEPFTTVAAETTSTTTEESFFSSTTEDPGFPMTTTVAPLFSTTTEDPTTTDIATTTVYPVTTTAPIIAPDNTSIRPETQTSPPKTTETQPTPPGPPVFTTNNAPAMTSVLPTPVCESTSCDLLNCNVTLDICLVTCVEGEENALDTSKVIDLLFKSCHGERDYIQLLVVDLFPTNILTENWLSIRPKVTKLRITAKLEKIEEGAFSSAAFSEIQELELRDTLIIRLENHVFMGLSSLLKLSLVETSFYYIPGDAFTNLPNLESLTIWDNSYPILLSNITASSEYPSIVMVDLQLNDIPIIPKESFVSVPNLQVLTLAKSKIRQIDVQAFKGANKELSMVVLKENLLTTLPEGLFSDYMKSPYIRIYLEGNPWLCTCDLIDLQNQMISEETAKYFPDTAHCEYPTKWANLPITEVDLCDLGTTTTTTPAPTPVHNTTPSTVTNDEVTASSPISRHPSEPPPTVYSCPRGIDEEEDFNPELSVVSMGAYRFNVTEIEEGVVLLQIHASCEDFLNNIFWFMNTVQEFNADLPQEQPLSCRPDVEDRLIIRNLKSNAIYTFCSIPTVQTSLSPFDCLSIYLLPPKMDQTWLTNRDRMLTFLIACVTILFVFFCGAILTYLCLRRGPTCFRRNKEAKSHQDMMFMPPLPKRNTTMTKKPLKRSVSDTSMASGRSYVSAIHPSPFEIVAWKLDRNRLRAPHTIYNLEKMPDFPAPIPPPKQRPSDTSHYSNLDEIYEKSRSTCSTGVMSSNHYSNYEM